MNTLSSEVVQWCSYFCDGNVALYKVGFEYMGGQYTITLCQGCLEEFIKNGPPGATEQEETS